MNGYTADERSLRFPTLMSMLLFALHRDDPQDGGVDRSGNSGMVAGTRWNGAEIGKGVALGLRPWPQLQPRECWRRCWGALAATETAGAMEPEEQQHRCVGCDWAAEAGEAAASVPAPPVPTGEGLRLLNRRRHLLPNCAASAALKLLQPGAAARRHFGPGSCEAGQQH